MTHPACARAAVGCIIVGIVAALAASDGRQSAAQAAAAPVRVTALDGGRPQPCPKVDAEPGPYVRGGCQTTVRSMEIDLEARTALGALPFGYDCAVTFDLHVAGDGRAWLDRILIGGTDPCSDVRPCEPDALAKSPADRRASPHSAVSDFTPWQGRVVATQDRRLALRADVCLDTCAGRYDGEIELALVRRGHRWSVRAERAPIGATGLALDGSWTVDDGRFRIAGAR